MRTLSVLVATAVLLGGAPLRAQERPLPMLVSAAWLEEHRDDTDLAILHVAYTRGEYLREHIAGARFLWFYGLVVMTPEAMTDLAPRKQVESVLGSLGVGDQTKIVLCYSGNAFIGAARIFYTLDCYGLGERTAILDGGLETWKAENRPVTSESPAVRQAKLRLRPRADCRIEAGELQRRLADPSLALLDARSKQAYEGVNQTRVLRPGHILGAKNLPATQLTDSLGQMKNPEKLQQLFAAAGAGSGKAVVAYCGVGQLASGVYFAARLSGLPVQLYDGSLDDWMYRDDSYPIEVTPASPVKTEELAQQVRVAEMAFAKSMADRKLDAFESHVAREALFFGRQGVLHGRAAVVDGWKQFFAGEQAPFSWEPETVEVLESGTLALSSGPVRDPQGKVIAHFSSIWRLEADGRWRVVFDKGCQVCGIN